MEGYVYAHIGGAGIVEGCAGKLLRLRKKLNAGNAGHIKIFADVKKKHCSHSLTGDLDITDEIRQAELFMVDGIIITGKFTGKKPDQNDVIKAKSATSLPILIGSGMTKENISDYMNADAFIIGSTFRKDGEFLADLDEQRLKNFMSTFTSIKNK